MSNVANRLDDAPSRTVLAVLTGRLFGCLCWLIAAVASIAPSAAQVNVPTFLTTQGTAVSIDEADRILRAGTPDAFAQALSPRAAMSASPPPAAFVCGTAAASLPVEITTLAAALKCDPDLIFEYVYNTIAYEPLFGSNKGALGTLLDQRGNDIDQAQLFTALLSAAGFSPSQLNYQYGYIRLNGTQASGWLGVKNDAYAIVQLLANGGIPFTNATLNVGDGTLAQADIAHVWVQVQIGGTSYVFDPSFKQNAVTNGLANLGSVLGYDQAQLLAAAGGSVDTVSISNINRAAIRSKLVTYAGNLVDYVRQQNPAASVADIVGGKSILPVAGSPLRQTVLSYLSPSQPAGFPQDWGAAIPDAYRTCFVISMPGVSTRTCAAPSVQSILLYADQTYGQRVTVFSVPDPNHAGNVIATLLINGSPPANGTNTGPSSPPGAAWSINVAITHRYANFTSPNQQQNLTVRAGGAYLIGAGWGQVGRGMVEQHRKLLAQALAVPGASPASEAVLGQSLAVISYSWLAEGATQQRLSDQIAKVTTQYHHGVGITAQTSIQQQGGTQGPYVDLPMNFFTRNQQTCWPNVPCDFLAASALGVNFTFSEMASALESAVLEQTQAPTPGMAAASTVKLIDLNVTGATNRTFFADGTSAGGVQNYFNLVRPNLSGYAGSDLSAIDCAISANCLASGQPNGQQVVLPSNGNIQVQLWHGAGYTIIEQTSNSISISQKISGGLSGGFTGTDVPTIDLNDNTAITNPPPLAAPEVPGFVNFAPFPEGPKFSDPVDAVSGTYIYKRTDLVTGGGGFPYALPFERVYRSSSNTSDVGLGNGWTHSYSLAAASSSDPYQAMGEGSPISAAAAIAALFVNQDILSGAKNAQAMTVAAVVTRWLTDQLTNNAVIISGPETTEQFIALPHPDNSATISYNPPFGSAASLVATGTSYSHTAKDGTRLTFAPAFAGALTSAISTWSAPNGTGVTFGYDGSGKLVTVANNLHRQLTLGYSGTRIATVTDDTGRSAVYGYDAGGNLISAADPLQSVTSYTYDNASRLTQIFYPSTPAVAFVANAYDALGRVSRQANANGDISSFHIAGSRTEAIDPAGTRHVTYQTPRGKVIKDAWVLGDNVGTIFNDTAQQNGLVEVARNQYDGQDRLVLATAPEGGAVGYAYSPDLKHNVIQLTATAKPGSPLAPLVTTYAYDPLYNKPTRVTDPRGLVTTMDYDAATGNLISVVADAGAAPHSNARRSFSYTGPGLLLTATDPLGTVTLSGYDGHGNRTSVLSDYGIGRLNQLTTLAYSAVGDVTSVTDPNGRVTGSTYDAARRPQSVTSPPTSAAPNGLVATFTYDADGKPIRTQRLAEGIVLNATSATYTVTGKPASATDANGNVARYAYDALDRLVSVTDPLGRETRFGYDRLGRRTAISNGAIQAAPLLQQSYSPDGLLASLTDAGNRTTTFAYDGFDRLATTTYPLGSTETFSYDADGNMLTRKTRANQTIAFTYDTLNRLATKTPPSPAPVVSYAYDLTGRLIGGSDTSAAVTAVAPAAPNTTYATSYVYDALNRPTAATWTPAPAAATPTPGSVTFSHSYSKANQRIAQSVTDNTWWEYPAASASTVAYTANALNQYTAVGAVTPSYDGNGNLTSDGTFTYGYDSENRLVAASGPGITASYAYDAQGRRKSKTVNGTTTLFVTDADNREVLEYDGGTGAVQRWYAHGPGPNDALNQMDVSANTRATFIPDILGSTIGTMDSATAAVAKVSYLPYGTSASSAGTFRYTGQRIDAETGGLYYYRARAYKAAWGRFMQVDPIGYQSGVNLYAYVGNDPLNLVDPFGLAADAPKGDTSAWGSLLPDIGSFLGSGAASLARIPTDISRMADDLVSNPLLFLQRAGPGLAGLGLSIPVGRFAGASVQETTTIYRAVTNAELNSIRSTGTFTNPVGIETKYFSTTLEGAQSFAARAASAFGQESSFVQTSIPSNLITNQMRVTVDRGINSVVVPTDLLSRLTAPRILP